MKNLILILTVLAFTQTNAQQISYSDSQSVSYINYNGGSMAEQYKKDLSQGWGFFGVSHEATSRDWLLYSDCLEKKSINNKMYGVISFILVAAVASVVVANADLADPHNQGVIAAVSGIGGGLSLSFFIASISNKNKAHKASTIGHSLNR